MFTGIIETTGVVKDVIVSGTNKTFWVASPLSEEFKIDQSVAHSGVCLTVEEISNGAHRVTAIEETLLKTNLHSWQINSVVNIERCMQMNGRIDGHMVQGHVDTVALCTNMVAKDGSWQYDFEFEKQFASLVIEKGSIAVNGTSLTIFNVSDVGFSVAIIPYTYEHTNMQYVNKNDTVNIEFDMIGKYINRHLQLKNR